MGFDFKYGDCPGYNERIAVSNLGNLDYGEIDGDEAIALIGECLAALMTIVSRSDPPDKTFAAIIGSLERLDAHRKEWEAVGVPVGQTVM